MKASTATLSSDEAIIDRCWARNESAIIEIDRKYRPYLNTVARNVLAVAEDCEECPSDTYPRI